MKFIDDEFNKRNIIEIEKNNSQTVYCIFFF